MIHRSVGDEAIVRLLDNRILPLIILTAILVPSDFGAEFGHHGRTGLEIHTAGDIEGLGDADDALLRGEERVGVL